MIEAQGVVKIFGGRTILHGIDATFETGKTNLIIGKSGSGKTVLLKSLVGLYDIDGGDIHYDGRSTISLNRKQKDQLRREVGMLFQGSALFDSKTVEENVRFPLDMFTDMSLEERRERANFCLQRVNIINSNHLYPSEISGGMQKRVAIARAIALNPKYLFCDEPNSGLDPVTASVIDELISEITKEYGITTIMNTHDMNSVFSIGEKIIFISEGNKAWEGSSDTIVDSGCQQLEEFIHTTRNIVKHLK
ncbi:MAG: ATP-binding cassette domain-containing protein [Bacteroidales bacterium]|nr:ATP-binding cassette domain-containing protein [Bacteroidales bacterium]